MTRPILLAALLSLVGGTAVGQTTLPPAECMPIDIKVMQTDPGLTVEMILDMDGKWSMRQGTLLQAYRSKIGPGLGNERCYIDELYRLRKKVVWTDKPNLECSGDINSRWTKIADADPVVLTCRTH